jgi:hypothetical protein
MRPHRLARRLFGAASEHPLHKRSLKKQIGHDNWSNRDDRRRHERPVFDLHAARQAIQCNRNWPRTVVIRESQSEEQIVPDRTALNDGERGQS